MKSVILIDNYFMRFATKSLLNSFTLLDIIIGNEKKGKKV